MTTVTLLLGLLFLFLAGLFVWLLREVVRMFKVLGDHDEQD